MLFASAFVRRRAKILVALGIFLSGFLGFNYLVATRPDKPLQPRAEQIWTVQTAIVEFQTAYPQKSAFGRVTAARQSSLQFNIAGEVAEVADIFQNGTHVRQGAVLARLDPTLLQIAHDEIEVQLTANTTAIAELKTQLELRQKHFDRFSQMQAAAVVSESSLDEARLALSIAKNALTQAEQQQQRLELSRQRAKRNLEDAVLRAPFAGIISDVQIGVGLVLSPTQAVGQMTDLSSLNVSFVVSSDVFADAPNLIGEAVEVIWRSGGRALSRFHTEISRVEGSIEASEGGGRLYADIPLDKDGAWTIPEGAFVEVLYSAGRVDEVVELPEAALYDDNSVFIIINNRTARRQVEVVQKADGVVYVRGALNAGDVVVATRLPALGDGLFVRPSAL